MTSSKGPQNHNLQNADGYEDMDIDYGDIDISSSYTPESDTQATVQNKDKIYASHHIQVFSEEGQPYGNIASHMGSKEMAQSVQAYGNTATDTDTDSTELDQAMQTYGNFGKIHKQLSKQYSLMSDTDSDNSSSATSDDYAELVLKPEITYENLIQEAVKGNSDEILNLLADPDVQQLVSDNCVSSKNELLMACIAHCDIRVVNELLKIENVSKNVAINHYEALRTAAVLGKSDIFNALLEYIQKNGHPNRNLKHLNKIVKQLYHDLENAAQRGQSEHVLNLLRIEAIREHAADLNNTVLRWAAEKCSKEVVKELLSIESVRENAAACDNEALHEAIKRGEEFDDVICDLLSISTVSNKANTLNNTALLLAAKSGNQLALLRLLDIPNVRKGAAVYDNSVLLWAEKNGMHDAVVELLKIPKVLAHQQANEIVYNMIEQAYKNQNDEELDKLREIPGYEVLLNEIKYEYMIELAEQGKSKAVLKLLTDPAVIVQIKKYTLEDKNALLMIAIAHCNIDVVKELLKIEQVSKNVAINNNEALKTAAVDGKVDIYNELLKYPQVKKHEKKTLKRLYDYLAKAAQEGNNDRVLNLLKIEAIRMHAGDNNNSVLKMAAQKCSAVVVIELLSIQGVHENISEDDIMALEKIARHYGATKVIEKLLENPTILRHKKIIDILNAAYNNDNVKIATIIKAVEEQRPLSEDDKNGLYSMLFHAIRRGKISDAMVLVKMPECMELAHKDENKLLFIACRQNISEIVEELLKLENVRKDAHRYNNTLLQESVVKNEQSIFDVLLTVESVRANAHADKNHALNEAAFSNREQMVESLLKIQTVRDEGFDISRFSDLFSEPDILSMLLPYVRLSDNKKVYEAFSEQDVARMQADIKAGKFSAVFEQINPSEKKKDENSSAESFRVDSRSSRSSDWSGHSRRNTLSSEGNSSRRRLSKQISDTQKRNSTKDRPGTF